jgi:flagellar motility protein MotE (MotC chaperone)
MLRLIVVLVIVFGGGSALAQKKMYRCGNQYQERPCEGPKADAAAQPGTTKSDPQKEQEAAAKRQEREQAVHQAKCENYGEELADVSKRIKAGADEKVMDQLNRRKREMETRISRECK